MTHRWTAEPGHGQSEDGGLRAALADHRLACGGPGLHAARDVGHVVPLLCQPGDDLGGAAPQPADHCQAAAVPLGQVGQARGPAPTSARGPRRGRDQRTTRRPRGRRGRSRGRARRGRRPWESRPCPESSHPRSAGARRPATSAVATSAGPRAACRRSGRWGSTAARSRRRKSRTVSPHTGHGRPVRPCTRMPARFASLADLGRLARRDADGVLEDLAQGGVETGDLLLVQARGQGERREPGGVQDLVGVGVARRRRGSPGHG